MNEKERIEIIQGFYAKEFDCNNYPWFKECEEMKKNFYNDLNKKGGCTPCRKRGVLKKHKSYFTFAIKKYE
jgi:hypothetical protein